MTTGRVSRAPVFVVALFFAVAVILVLIGAQRPLEVPPEVHIARAGTPALPRELTVIMRDYRFDPTPIVLVPGETVRFTIFNGGLVEHEFSLGDASRPGRLVAGGRGSDAPQPAGHGAAGQRSARDGGSARPARLGPAHDRASTRCPPTRSWRCCATCPVTSSEAWSAGWSCAPWSQTGSVCHTRALAPLRWDPHCRRHRSRGGLSRRTRKE